MKKIISLFQRNYDTDKLVRPEIIPGAEWVIKGEGFATQKLDGKVKDFGIKEKPAPACACGDIKHV